MKNPFLSPLPLSPDLAALMLRLLFGGLFIYHGYGKMEAFDEYYASFPDLIGIGGKLSFILVIFAEFFCGLLVALGLFIRLALIPIFIAMFVAFFIAHKSDPFPKKELAFLFMLLVPTIYTLGAGKFSLDHLFIKNG